MRRPVLLTVVLLACASLAEAQNFRALQIIKPLAVGTAGTGLDADNAWYFAYPGITWSRKMAVIGGNFPYTYSIVSGAGAGMTIAAGPCTSADLFTCRAGVITWVNPQTSATPTFRVCDADSVCADVTITITVTDASTRFRFIDMDDGNDTTGDGTLSLPWKTIAKAQASAGTNRMVYFLPSVTKYNLDGGVTGDNDCSLAGEVRFNDASTSTQFIGHPDSQPIIDFQYTGAGNVTCIEFQGPNITLINLRMERSFWMAYQFVRTNSYGVTLFDLAFDEGGPGVDEFNTAFLMWTQLYSGDQIAHFDTIQNVAFTNLHYGTGFTCCKSYSMKDPLYESITIDTMDDGEEASLALKSNIDGFTVRGVEARNIDGLCFGGSMNYSLRSQDATNGEFNFVNCLGTVSRGAFRINENANAEAVQVYRSAMQHNVGVEDVITANGLFTFVGNAIQDVGSGGSCPSGITCTNISDYTRISQSGNTIAASGILNANGTLVDTAGIGTYGWQLTTTATKYRFRFRTASLFDDGRSTHEQLRGPRRAQDRRQRPAGNLVPVVVKHFDVALMEVPLGPRARPWRQGSDDGDSGGQTIREIRRLHARSRSTDSGQDVTDRNDHPQDTCEHQRDCAEHPVDHGVAYGPSHGEGSPVRTAYRMSAARISTPSQNQRMPISLPRTFAFAAGPTSSLHRTARNDRQRAA